MKMKANKKMLLMIGVLTASVFTYIGINTNKLSQIEEPITSSTYKLPDPSQFNDVYSPEEWEAVDKRFEALVNATFRLETGNGTSNLWINNNNPGGIKGYYTGDYTEYQSKEHGMQSLRELLTDYVSIHGYDLKAIRERYCYECGQSDLKTFTELFNEELESMQ